MQHRSTYYIYIFRLQMLMIDYGYLSLKFVNENAIIY